MHASIRRALASIAAAALFPLAALGQPEPTPAQPSVPTASARPYAEQYGTTTARFAPTEADLKASGPSAVLPRPPRFVEPLSAEFAVVPRFSVDGDKRRVSIDVPPGATVHGLGDVAETLTLSGTFENIVGLKCVLMVLRPDGSGFAVIADTPYPLDVEIGRTIELRSAAPVLPVIISGGSTPMEIATAIADLTGRIEMPPRWGLGLLVECGTAEVARKARAWAGTPFAAAVVPGGLSADELTRLRESIAPAHVAIAVDQLGARPIEDPAALAAPTPGGELAPQSPKVPDLTSAAGRDAWAGTLSAAHDSSIMGAVVQWTGVPAALEFEGERLWGRGDGTQYGSVLPRLASELTRRALDPDESGDRPFIVSTWWSAGSQRYGAALTSTSIPRLLNLSISGQHLLGARAHRLDDLGAAICALPLALGVADHLGRLGGEPTRLAAMLRVRARLTPYIYYLMFESYYQGKPMVRPLFFAEPASEALRTVDWCYLLGQDLLVVPTNEDGLRPAPPLNGWRKLDLGESDPAIPDFYLRPGAILPTASPEQSVDANTDPLVLLINLDAAGQASGWVYEDDGHTYEMYKQQFRYMGHRAELKDGNVDVRVSMLNGGWGLTQRTLRAVVLRDHGNVTGEGTELGTLRIPMPPPTQRPTEPR
jgi:alpha-glucosidase